MADAIGVRSTRGRAGGGRCDRCQMHEGEGAKMQKKLNILRNLYELLMTILSFVMDGWIFSILHTTKW